MRENAAYSEVLDLASKYPVAPVIVDLGCLSESNFVTLNLF